VFCSNLSLNCAVFYNTLHSLSITAQVKNFQLGNSIGRATSATAEAAGRRLAATSFDVFSNGAEWITGAELGYMILIVICTMITIVVSGRYIKLVPPILLGVIVATIVECE
jgi:hypothetical protein